MPSLEYLAGIFDGEGCVTLTIIQRSLDNFQLVVQVKMVDKRIPDCFQQKFGGKVDSYQPPGNCREIYLWRCWSDEALGFLKAVRPFLIVKASQAEVGIKFQEERGLPWHRRSKEDRERDKSYKKILGSLNRRGRVR